jgi:hypothetical protein
MLSFYLNSHQPAMGTSTDPAIIACVAVPHHCPCPFPTVEDKFELGEGSAICVSKGGFKAGEAARKIELARKGLI